jgi:hypothetical protein
MVPWSRAGRYATGVNELHEVVERAVAAYDALADLAETVEDEWQYVTDLVDAYMPGIRSLAAADPGRFLTVAQVAAVDEAIAEIGLIADPHKAIDWLSTFPHVVGLALGGDVDRPAGPAGDGSLGAGSEAAAAATSGSEPAEPDEDSPFRMLRGGR